MKKAEWSEGRVHIGDHYYETAVAQPFGYYTVCPFCGDTTDVEPRANDWNGFVTCEHCGKKFYVDNITN